MYRIASIAATTAVLFGLAAAPGGAVSLQPIGSFSYPVSVVSAPMDPDRLFVGEREGRIVELEGGVATEIADLSALVTCCQSERGLLSIALAQDFESSGRFYVAYTGTVAAGGDLGDVHLDSIRPDPLDSTDLGREPILSIPHAARPNHNIGQIQFGPDGHLYVAVGDGGGEGDPLESGQDVESLLGKILRIDPLPGEEPAYAIPADNPFVGAVGRDEIWSLGLRNPWRFSLDAASGDLVIGDVGQGEREEVDLARSSAPGAVGGAGANYGWSCREGLIAYAMAPSECGGLSGFTEPVFDYVHQNPVGGAAYGCSIIGGYVSRDPGVDELFGRYVYADFCIGQLRSLVLPATDGGAAAGDRSEGPVVERPTSFGEDSCRRLYLTTAPGEIYRLVGAQPTACRPTAPIASPPPAVDQRRARRPRLLLSARRPGQRARIVARLSPCAGHAGERVQLNRGGRRLAVHRLNRRCRARFLARVAAAATFRALMPDLVPRLRSPRLALSPPGPRR